MASNIPVIVQGNSFNLAIPLQIYVINGDQMELQDYIPDPTDQISIQLKGARRNYTYTPTSVTDNVCMIALGGYELADNYSVVVSIVKANGQRLRSFRTDQFFIVESSDDLTQDDIIQGLEENVIYLNSSIFVAGADGRGIESIIKTGTSGLVDTYTITYSDETTSTFNVTNGAPGQQGEDGVGIISIEKTATAGKVDTYTITMTDGSTFTFQVTNGMDGVDLGLAYIVNDLTTGGATNVLSAEMGKELGSTNVGDLSKNIFNIDGWQDNYYLPNANGSTNNQWDTSGYIEVKNGKQYCIRIGESIPKSSYDYYTLWDANKTYLGKATIDTTTGVISVDQANVKYMRACLYRPSGYTQPTTGVVIKREHVKYFLVINEGTEIVDRRLYNQLSVKNEVESGFVKETVMNTVRNLFDWDNYVVGSLPNGVYSDSGNYKVTPFIDVADLGETLMQWSLNGTNNSTAVLFAYDENQNPLTTIACPYNSTGGYLVPAAAKYVRGYCINLLLCLSVGGAIPTQDYEPTPKIDEDYIPMLSRFTGGKVAFLGDSFTAMGTYPRMTATLAHFGEWYNWGTSAYKYSALKTRLESYASIVPSLDAIVILGGANDFASSDGPSSLTSACSTLISYIYSLNPTITILHLTPTYTYGYTPPGGTQRTDTDSNGIHIREYANAIRSACDELGVPVLDTYRTLGITQYNVASMTRDGLHPTDAVFKKLGWQVAQALAKL